MLKHNTYFEGQVQSIGFTRVGRAQSVGVVCPGDHRFGTQAPERMSVISGEFWVKRASEDNYQLYAAGTSFEVAGDSSFEIRVLAPAAYLCEYL